jgi:hypothetical protein
MSEPIAIIEIAPDFAANSVTAKEATDLARHGTLRAVGTCL